MKSTPRPTSRLRALAGVALGSLAAAAAASGMDKVLEPTPSGAPSGFGGFEGPAPKDKGKGRKRQSHYMAPSWRDNLNPRPLPATVQMQAIIARSTRTRFLKGLHAAAVIVGAKVPRITIDFEAPAKDRVVRTLVDQPFVFNSQADMDRLANRGRRWIRNNPDTPLNKAPRHVQQGIGLSQYLDGKAAA